MKHWIVLMVLASLIFAYFPTYAETTASLGSSHFKFDSYEQIRMMDNIDSTSYIAMRRLKGMITWTPSPGWTVYAQALYKDGNVSSSDARLWFQEFWIRKEVREGWLQAGQFKPPFGMERFTPDTELETMDRSMASDHLVPNAGLPHSFTRDIGFQWETYALGRGLKTDVGIFTGNGAWTETFTGNGPLVAGSMTKKWSLGRTDWTSCEGGLSYRQDHNINFSGALTGDKPFGISDFQGSDTRWDAAGDVNLGDWALRSEYIGARFHNTARKNVLYAEGWYAQLSDRWARRWDSVMKFEEFNPNTGATGRFDTRWTTFGINYYMRGEREKIQLGYVMKSQSLAGKDHDILDLQYQHYF